MPACYDTALADFELPWIDYGEREFTFVDDRPPFFATCHSFTKVAWVFQGKLNQLPSPVQPQVDSKNACRVRFGQTVAHIWFEFGQWRDEELRNRTSAECGMEWDTRTVERNGMGHPLFAIRKRNASRQTMHSAARSGEECSGTERSGTPTIRSGCPTIGPEWNTHYSHNGKASQTGPRVVEAGSGRDLRISGSEQDTHYPHSVKQPRRGHA